MAVLLTPPYLQFFDDNGNPLSGGKIYTYAAGTLTPKATYTNASETTPLSNPIILDSAGRATIWISGSYYIEVKTSADVAVKNTDNITAFNTSASSINSLLPSQSGNAGKALTTDGTNSAWGGVLLVDGQLTVYGTSTTAGTIVLGEDTDNGVNNITVKAPSAITANRNIEFPDKDGTVAMTSDIASSRFVSSAQTITPAGSLTIAHGLGATPVELNAYLTCTSADAGYSIGARVAYYPMAQGNVSATSNSGVTVNSNATNLVVRFGQSVSPSTMFINEATTGVLTGIDITKWTITFIARP